MPELPDLEYIVEKLHDQTRQTRIVRVEVVNPIILRNLLAPPAEAHVQGRTIEKVRRHGPFVVLELDGDRFVVVHPMLAGRFDLRTTRGRKAAADAVVLHLADNRILLYQDSKQMGKVYLADASGLGRIPRFATQGPDILSSAFTQAYFLQKAGRSRKQVRVLLMEQEVLSAIGNAYADEILFKAGLHPKTFCYQLSEEQLTALYRAILEVLEWGIACVKKAGRPLPDKVREHMRVRNRQGQPCPVCGTKIRRAGVRGYDAFFCPQCQPAARAQFISWC